MQTRSIISQLYTAIRNPTALLLGGACGALVPLGTCYVTHELLRGDLVQLSVLPLLVLGGLVFSCLSVYAFARAVFGAWYKALGFVVALEGYMTFTAGWLSVAALVFLAAINAIANGCRVAAEREAEPGTVRPSSAAGHRDRPRLGALPGGAEPRGGRGEWRAGWALTAGPARNTR
jgi:hypothetical protein